MNYVRCRWCDSAVTTEQVEILPLKKNKEEEQCRHDLFLYECPCCGYETKSFLFFND